MAKWGKTDFRQLKEFQKRLEKLENVDADAFFEEASKELAARLLRKVIRRTPVGKPPAEFDDKAKRKEKITIKDENGKEKKVFSADAERYQKYWKGYVGGTLRRGWTAGKGNVTEFINNVDIKHVGNSYEITIENNVEYISYVEYGHRQHIGAYVPALGKKLKSGWVDGKFMLTISEKELNNIAPKLLEKRLNEKLKEVFNAD